MGSVCCVTLSSRCSPASSLVFCFFRESPNSGFALASILLLPWSSRVVPRCQNSFPMCSRDAKMESQGVPEMLKWLPQWSIAGTNASAWLQMGNAQKQQPSKAVFCVFSSLPGGPVSSKPSQNDVMCVKNGGCPCASQNYVFYKTVAKMSLLGIPASRP